MINRKGIFIMNRTIILNDNLSNLDTVKPLTDHYSPYYRTEVIAGYDYHVDEMGRDRFGKEIFRKENMTLIGGGLFTLEKLFGLRANSPTVSQLKDVFASQNIPAPDGWTDRDPNPHNVDNIVCLFGVGIGGADDSIASVRDVKYYQRNIENMVPFRQVTNDTVMTKAEHEKYYCRSVSNGVISYYLKKFDNAEIKCKWRDADEEAEGSDVQNEYWTTSSSVTTPIETYIQLRLQISKYDVREYFQNVSNGVELARVNTVGLFTGVPVTLENPVPVQYDGDEGEPYKRTIEYDQVTCFSALNFDNEMLSLPKDLTIIYRIFVK
jgi:hypothetical protein